MQFLIESVTAEQNEHITDFFGFVCEKLGIADHPTVTFSPDLGTTSFGTYTPSEATVHVATEGRHISDILRTFGHELVHHKQLTSGSQLDLEGLEYEANAVAGMLMRDYNKLHPEMFGLHNHADVPPEGIPESQGATDADTTRPSQPVELAELSNKTLASYKRKAKAELRNTRDGTYGKKYFMRDYFHNQDLAAKRKMGIKTAEAKLKARYAPLKEDAPVNAAGSGEIAGIGVGPQGEPGIKKSNMIRRKPKSGLATIFAGFPRKTLKEYKAPITNKLNWDEIMKDKNEPSPMGSLGLPHTNMRLYNAVQKRRKNLGFLGLPDTTLKQALKGKKTFKQFKEEVTPEQARKEFANTPKSRTESEEKARKALLNRTK